MLVEDEPDAGRMAVDGGGAANWVLGSSLARAPCRFGPARVDWSTNSGVLDDLRFVTFLEISTPQTDRSSLIFHLGIDFASHFHFVS
ncbi:hypothetical protein RB779 [Rhodopirellula baltica SH 1]|uniref:Uncharacterized protein n=1 Tax=Rhodopirellula baltica (strain DSM 10527 / NCIMB 13988 / SH1) TaxID=243090 RepID=Q7UYA0_RHOBA|nr:hypothetical protein RB779 [Rhodopirellula baltica SH 1]